MKESDNLLEQQTVQLDELKRIVLKTIEDEKLIIDNLLNPPQEILTRGQKVSDNIARFGGSWTFVISFLLVLAVWILFNVVALQYVKFDPYPFILLNLILSCIAALQAPVIMMSQNRQEEKDRKRSENDYMVNLKAELEIRALHQKVDLVLVEQIKVLVESQAKQLEILKGLEDKINGRS